MIDAVDFLDELGRNARLHRASTADLEQALVDAQIDPESRYALLSDDALRLGELLGARPNVCCLIVKPDPERPDEEDEDEDEDPDEEDDEALV
jgi:hypothetical protein